MQWPLRLASPFSLRSRGLPAGGARLQSRVFVSGKGRSRHWSGAPIGANLHTNLTLRSGPQGRVSSRGVASALRWATEQVLRTGLFYDFVCGPSFETAATRPPQDEVVDWNIVKVSAYEWRAPQTSSPFSPPPFIPPPPFAP